VNGDGFSDLVVGAPFAPAGGTQRGMIAVMFAASNLQGLTLHL